MRHSKIQRNSERWCGGMNLTDAIKLAGYQEVPFYNQEVIKGLNDIVECEKRKSSYNDLPFAACLSGYLYGVTQGVRKERQRRKNAR
jgi:hypothetical protein